MAAICPVNDVIDSPYILLPHNLAACWHSCGRIACLGRVSTKNPMQLSSIYRCAVGPDAEHARSAPVVQPEIHLQLVASQIFPPWQITAFILGFHECREFRAGWLPTSTSG